MIEILSFGAGVQSTTLLYMSCDGHLPKLDHVIFADTHAEPEGVYAHLERCKEKAAKAGIEIVIDSAGDLREDLIGFWGMRRSADGKRHASIPAFVKNKDGSRGMVRRQCTGTYKIDVVEKVTRRILGLSRGQRWPLIPTMRQWIGISADEMQRRRTSQRPAIKFWYPLIDECKVKVSDLYGERGFTRQDCLDWMQRHGYELPPRSDCTFCPFHSDEEWARMKQFDPASFADAVNVDRQIRSGELKRQEAKGGELRGEPYLHSSLIPLEMVEFDPVSDHSEGRGMANECMGMCGV
jgi:hypothetical protein